MPFFAHMGMLYVSFGGKSKLLSDNSVIHGGSAYGSGCVAPGPAPTALELQVI